MGAAGRGRAESCGERGLQAVRAATCQNCPLVLGCCGKFLGELERGHFPGAPGGQDSWGVGWLLVLGKDARWASAALTLKLGVAAGVWTWINRACFNWFCQKPHLKILPLCIGES